jgi:hypothetical protein
MAARWRARQTRRLADHNRTQPGRRLATTPTHPRRQDPAAGDP